MSGWQEVIMTTDVGLIYGLVAVGVYLTFRTINFADMTCDGSFVFGSSVCATLIQGGASPGIAMLFATIAGGIAGLFTGILNVYCKISDLLSGIIVAFMLYSINLKVMGGMPNITLNDLELSMNSCAILAIIVPLTVLLVYLLFTDFGLALRSIGYNKRFSEVMGNTLSAFEEFGDISTLEVVAANEHTEKIIEKLFPDDIFESYVIDAEWNYSINSERRSDF